MQIRVSPLTKLDNSINNVSSITTQTNNSIQFFNISTPFNPSIKHLIPSIIGDLFNIQNAQAAYRTEGQAGHGNLILGANVQLQGYISDLPEDYDIEANREHDQQLGRRCKHINIGTINEAKVCVGTNNHLPEKGDHDFILVDNQWYKLRTGTVYVSRNQDGTHHLEPVGVDIIPSEIAIYRISEAINELKKIPTIIHQVDSQNSIGAELAYILSNKPRREPVDYLHRLHNEQGIGPLPVMPLTWEEIIASEEAKNREHHERSNEKYNKHRSDIMP